MEDIAVVPISLERGDPLKGITIETQSVKDFKLFIKLLLDRKPSQRTMGAVTGTAGIGKTKAIRSFLDSRKLLSHTGLSDVIFVTLIGSPSQRAVADAIAEQLRGKVSGKNAAEIAGKIADQLKRNDIRLVIIDEADLMDEKGFELVRGIFDLSTIPILVVGLPDILTTISRYDKFESRVGLKQEFLPATKAEFMEVILPVLPFDHWIYISGEAESLAMGEFLFNRVGTSFRKLCALIATANDLASAMNMPKIEMDLLQLATKWSPANKIDAGKDIKGNNQPTGDAKTLSAPDSPEGLSERKNAAKRKHPKRKGDES